MGRSPGAVIVGGYLNGLGLVRALAARGVPTVVIRTEPFDIAHRSKHVPAHESALGLDRHPDRLRELLERKSRDWPGWAVLPANDWALEALARDHERLSAPYKIVAPPWETARVFLDKELMLKAASNIGVAAPCFYGPATTVSAELPDLKFPLVIKPSEGHRFAASFDRKLLVAKDRAELRRHLAQVAGSGLACGLFDLIPGPDTQIFTYNIYMDARGEPLGGLTVRKIRQSPPLYGVARVAEAVGENGELREATIELLRRIGYRGMATAEFKLDPRDGRFRFIEVNGRSVIYNALARKAGLDLAGLAWSDYVEGRAERPSPTGWPGTWVNLHADLLYAAFRRRDEPSPVTGFWDPYKRPIVEAAWSAGDPAPFFAQWGGTLWRGAARFLRGRRPRTNADRSRPGAAA